MLDYSRRNVTSKKASAIREEALSAQAKICILPANKATQEYTESLNTLGVSVWYKAKDNTEVEMFTLVTSGANGIITSDRALMEKVLTSDLFKENTIIRPIGVIGHRGTPALAPENTLEGSMLAALNGANIIENDIYITTDGVIVVMHDASLKRTTNGGDVNIETLSYAQLQSISITAKPELNSSPHGIINPPLAIPTLEDYFETFKGTDTFMFIEIKSGKIDRIIPALKELIDEYDIADQCGVIAFSQDAVVAVRNTIPEISAGFLYSDYTLSTIVNKTSNLGSSYNPSYTGLSAELISDLSARGTFTWPWTVNNNADFDKLFLWGVAGITTDHSYYAKDYVKRISADSSEYTFKVGEKLSVPITAETYGAFDESDTYENRTYTANRATMSIISGNDTVKYSYGKLSATESGDATVMFKLTYELANGTDVYVYTQPITIHVEADNTQPVQTETEATTPPDADIQDTDIQDTDSVDTSAEKEDQPIESETENTDTPDDAETTEIEESETDKPSKPTSSDTSDTSDDEQDEEDEKEEADTDEDADDKEKENEDEEDEEDEEDGCTAFAPITALSCAITLIGSAIFLKKKED